MSLYDDLLAAGLPVELLPDGSFTFSRSISEDETQTYHDILNPLRVVQRNRQQGAKAGAALAGQFKTATGQQAADYVQQQITNGTSEATALAAFDNAATFAAAKPILRNMLIAIYRITDILKLMARILVAIRDYVMPELPEE